VDYGIIVEKDRGLNEKVAGIFCFELFSNGKRRELGPWPMNRSTGQFTVDQGHGLGRELVGALAPSRFRTWGPDASCGKGRERYGGSVLPIAEAWEAVSRRRTSGDVSAWKGDGVNIVGNRRRIVGGVGSFIGGGAAFYRAEAM
jgi:hypothetical protein